jgi:hypothetical protein
MYRNHCCVRIKAIVIRVTGLFEFLVVFLVVVWSIIIKTPGRTWSVAKTGKERRDRGTWCILGKRLPSHRVRMVETAARSSCSGIPHSQLQFFID